MFIITCGDIGEGYNFVGPFENEDDAVEWGEANLGGGWVVMPILTPQDEEAKRPMSQEAYEDANGVKCPSCKQGDINVKAFKLADHYSDPNSQSQSIAIIREKDCNECKAEWYEVYNMTGYRFKWRNDTPERPEE